MPGGVRSRAAILLAAALAPLLVLTALLWRSYAEAWLPVHRWAVERLLPDFRVERFELVRTGRETYLHLDAVPRHAIVVGARVVASASHVRVDVPAAHAVAHAAIVAAVALACGFARGGAALRLAVGALVALALVEMLDVPLCLAGGVWDVLQQAAHAGENGVLAAFGAFFDNGGRYAFTLVAALLGVRLAPGAARRSPPAPAAA